MATPIPKNDVRFSIAEIVTATAGRLVGGTADVGGVELDGVAIDSRAVSAGALFVAVRGDTQDGSKYIPAALAAGAGALLVPASEPAVASYPDSVARIEVEDTTRALGDLAAYHRQRWGGRVVAITGSAGKTTTKELTAAALEGAGAHVLKTLGNLNNQFGVPMMLLCATEQHDTAVLELGTSGPGEIARLGEIARPQVAVVLLAALAHTEGLVSLAAVADEKASLWAALGADGTAIINADDVELMQRAPRNVKLLSFGSREGATVRLLGSTLKVTGTRTQVAIDGIGELEFDLRMLGHAAAIDACAAIATVLALFAESDRLPAVEAAVRAMEKVEPTPGRMACIATRSGVTVCDDSYNANPRSMSLGLETLHALAQQAGGRSIAVVADMKDLGLFAHSEHVRIGELAVRLGIDVLVGCGVEMAHATSAAGRLSGGRLAPHPTRVAHVMTPSDAVALVQGMCRSGDVVLVKGSRAMEMDKVVAALVASFGGAA
ncbi:MAG: UDP-N-acetylmuramoylalanyl-D-glutamyl-2,6-diaminopimelate--D-alanyl-D-alanine ligase [Myxococcaceae bacterium]|nr:UDP-N-acetylmuramoylalanyl-D-glutamyl-2,6-diaminopimelate--D-alanyl-D-alanine ligase [Myxococcaceae bacterium]